MNFADSDTLMTTRIMHKDSNSFCNNSKVKRVKYSESNHGGTVLEKLQMQRQEGILTDVCLEVGVRRFPCHRNVLAACSPYFQAMFAGGLAESQQGTVALCDVAPPAIEAILDFAYTGSLSLDEDIVQDVYMAAHLLQATHIVHFCSDYLQKSLTAENWVGMFQLASTFSDAGLCQAASEFAWYHFPSLWGREEFLHAPDDVVQWIVCSQQLNVGSEGEVFDAIFRWYEHDPKERRQDARILVKHVTQEHLDKKQLKRAMDEGLIPYSPALLDVRSARSDLEQVLLTTSRIGGSAQELLLLGGKKNSRQFCIHCVNIATKDSWMLELPAYCRSYGALSVVVGNDIYCLSNDYQDKGTFRYNHIGKKWVQVAPRLVGRSNFQLSVVNGRIYALGGINDWSILNSMECYDPAVDEWSLMTPMPRNVIDFTSIDHRDSIYVFSGSRTMRYDCTTDEWTAVLPAMPTPRLSPATVTMGNEIWLIGGSLASDPSHITANNVEKYDVRSSTWEVAPPLDVFLRSCIAAQFIGKVYLCGHPMALGPVTLSRSYDLYLYDKSTDSCVPTGIPIPITDVTPCGVARMFTKNLTPYSQSPT